MTMRLKTFVGADWFSRVWKQKPITVAGSALFEKVIIAEAPPNAMVFARPFTGPGFLLSERVAS